MFGLGAVEIFIIGVLALVFIGPKKLPELAKGLGKGFREFQKAKDDLLNEVNKPEEIDEKVASVTSKETPQVLSDQIHGEDNEVYEEDYMDHHDDDGHLDPYADDVEATVSQDNAVSEEKKNDGEKS